MSRGLQIALIASILLLAVGVAGLGAYVFLKPATASAQTVVVKEVEAKAAPGEAFFFKTKNFITDLADKDRLRYVDATVALAMKDAPALEVAKKMEPQIRDIILGQMRQRVAAELAGSSGKEKLAETLQKALDEVLKGYLVKVYVTDLVVQ